MGVLFTNSLMSFAIMAIITPIDFINRLEFCPNDGHYIGYLMLGFQYQQR